MRLFLILKAGGCFGAILGSWAVDTFGRRYGTMAFALLAIVASVIVAAAQNIAMFIVGRFIAGFASIAFIGISISSHSCADLNTGCSNLP